MNILVCISVVPDTTSKINFKDENTSFETQGVQFIINPNDEFGLTRAIWLQQNQEAKVTVVTVGDVSCEPILRKCFIAFSLSQTSLLVFTSLSII